VTAAVGPRKLIEVALPLDEINAACKADKDRKTGTIRNLHKWFAPMPLPAWRALVFAALVDDPADDEKRAYLLDLIKRLVVNGADLPDPETTTEAREIIFKQFSDGVPIVMDPFCGGGSTLVEAQRLGLATFGSDLNPIPVVITRTLTELLPAVYGRQPIHHEVISRDGDEATRDDDALMPIPDARPKYDGYEGLISDTIYYAKTIREQAWRQLQHLYPTEPGETPIAWLWVRTALCPNPACGIETILTTSWWLSRRDGELAWIEPSVVDGQVRLVVKSRQRAGGPSEAPKIGRAGTFRCINCREVITDSQIRCMGTEGKLGLRMTAVVSSTKNGRIYRSPTNIEIRAAAEVARPSDLPEVSLGEANRYVTPPRYGIRTQLDLYTNRQLTVIRAFADLVASTHGQMIEDGATKEWAATISTLLGLAVGKMAQYGSSQAMITTFTDSSTRFNSGFGRNDLPMTWDFYEMNFFGSAAGDWERLVKTCLAATAFTAIGTGTTLRIDAREAFSDKGALVATDPPYFDAIAYADLSDAFYFWHRRALKAVHPDLYTTVAAPKSGELTAFPWHHGGTKDGARDYFIDGFTQTFKNLQRSALTGLPLLVVYASKEQKGGREEETRWSSILTAAVASGLEITGTSPVHGTGSTRMRGMGSNAVATYVVMVCRPRLESAGSCSLADFNRALRRELKPAVHEFQAAGILPVDLAQAAMGPGMQVYSRHRQVIDQSGNRVSVEQALRLINAALGEVLDEQEGELDPYSRFAVAWWEKHGWNAGTFGEADQLARPQGIFVDDVIRAEVACYPKPGFVALLGSRDLDRDWKPSADSRPTAWEAVHHLSDRLIFGGGELEAGRLIGELGTLRDSAQALVYRLHDIAAKKGRTKDQERYNALIGSWSDLLAVAASNRDGLF
jgi:putative DNA methylase